jgi:hypothetical protein
VIDRDHIDAIGALLREHVQAQHKVLAEALHEYRTAQFKMLEETLIAHLRAQSDMVDRLLDRLEAVLRAPSGEPEARKRLDS